MTLKVLENSLEISKADKNFFDIISFDTITSSSSVLSKNKVVYESIDGFVLNYFLEESEIYYSKENDFWFSHIIKNKKILYAFGSGKPDILDTLTPHCVIDFASKGTNKDTPGVFAEDENNNQYLLIRLNYPELRKNSFKGSSSVLNLEKAEEKNKKRVFINIGQLNEPDFLVNLKNFINENKNSRCLEPTLNEPSNKETNEDDSCVICGNSLSGVEYPDYIPSDLLTTHSNKCPECVEKIFAVEAVREVKNYVINFFNEESLLKKVDNPELFHNYLLILKKEDLIKELSNNVFMFREKKVVDKFMDEYSIYHTHLTKTISQKDTSKIESGTNMVDEKDSSKAKKEETSVDNQPTTDIEKNGSQNCEICSKTFEAENNSLKRCKECSRKAYAVRALKSILNYIESDTPFKKDDLLKQSNNRMQFLDYIWTLQEMNLLEIDTTPDTYILKKQAELDKFIEKYEDNDDTSKEEKVKPKRDSGVTNSPVKVVKTCLICKEKLPISEFYKSPDNDDGFTDKCKECSRKSYAARALHELLKCVEPEVLFYKRDLLDQCENRMQFLDYLWTMQELDLLEHDEKNNSYMLKSQDQLNAFIEKYSDIELEKTLINETSTKKAVKKCGLCGETLPVSSFYKSAESADGFTDKCKDCSEKSTVIKVLREIQDYVQFGESFSKDDLLKQVEDPTRANYYIWTLQEQNIIVYNEKTDSYIIEINDNLKKYQELMEKATDKVEEEPAPDIEEPIETPEISVEEASNNELTPEIKEELEDEDLALIKKEIVFISQNNGFSNIMMKGIVKNENIISTLGVLKCISSSINKLFVHRYDDEHSDITIDLEFDKNKEDKILSMLERENWENLSNNK